VIRKEITVVVEDDEPSFILLKIVLEKLGLECIWVKNGDDAITVCKERDDIKMVLMDINLPTMSGYTATKKIKQLKPALPIIAQTAFAIAGDREKAFDAGCDDYISKPIHQKTLVKIIRKFFTE